MGRDATNGRGFMDSEDVRRIRRWEHVSRWGVVCVALLLMLRDFAGIASQTLLSLYLQRVWGYDVKHAGFTLGE